MLTFTSRHFVRPQSRYQERFVTSSDGEGVARNSQYARSGCRCVVLCSKWWVECRDEV